MEKVEEEEYNQLIDKTSLKEVKIMELTWADQIRVEGKAQGKADWLIKILVLRNIKIEQTQKDTVLACTDVAQLETWLEKALTATSAEQVFGKPTKAKAIKKK